MTLPDRTRVRLVADHFGLPAGAEGVVGYTHPESGNPVVVVDSGGERRLAAFTLDELEVIALPEITAALDGATSRRSDYDWRVFDPRKLVATLTAKTIRLSQAAVERLAGVQRVTVLYDRGRGAIALKPAADTSRQTFKLTHVKSGCSLSAGPFLALIDLGDGGSRQLAAAWDETDAVLVIRGVPFRRA